MTNDLEKYEALATEIESGWSGGPQALGKAIRELIAMVRQGRNNALEEAAKIAFEYELTPSDSLPEDIRTSYECGNADTAQAIAEAIRALKGK